MNEEIEIRVVRFLKGRFPAIADSKTNESLLESGIMDSLGILDLVPFLEGEFSTSIADDEFARRKIIGKPEVLS